MNYFKEGYKKVTNFTYDHPRLRTFLVYFGMTMAAAISALIFAYGYKAFVAPIAKDSSGAVLQNIVTGGASGISQIVVKICDLFGVPINQSVGSDTTVGYIIQSSMYVLINLPITVLAFRKIGKRFAIFSVINVGLYFVFVNILPTDASLFFYQSSNQAANLTNNLFVRTLLAGLCTGLSSAIAVQTGHSSGGIDAISVYITGKKTNFSIGRVSMLINVGIIVIYTMLSCIQDNGPDFIPTAVFSFVYFFASSSVLDAVITRNKKMKLEIITENEELPSMLITYFPHSATVQHGQGAYAHHDKVIITTVLSNKEVKRATKLIKEADPKAFIIITRVEQLIGRFYIEPHK